MINKTFGKLSVNNVVHDIQKEILENETKIKTLREVIINNSITS
jgi:hypothetical protein